MSTFFGPVGPDRGAERSRRPVFRHASGLDVIGHRGFGQFGEFGPPENSPAAVQRAAAAGADWVEIDARRTSNRELAVHHDNLIRAMSTVSEYTAQQLRQSGIHLLDQIIASLPPGLGLNIEIKPDLIDSQLAPSERTTGLVLSRLQSGLRDNPVLLTSFDAMAIQQVLTERPDIPTGLLTWKTFPIEIALNTAVHLGTDVLAVHVSSLHLKLHGSEQRHLPQEAVEHARARGLQLMAWGVQPADIPRLQALRISAVCVDDVSRAVNYRAAPDSV